MAAPEGRDHEEVLRDAAPSASLGPRFQEVDRNEHQWHHFPVSVPNEWRTRVFKVFSKYLENDGFVYKKKCEAFPCFSERFLLNFCAASK